MPKGGGLPLCLSGVCIMAQVPQRKTTLCSSSSRNRSSSRGSSATRNFDVRAELDLNVAESRSRACDSEERSREDSNAVPSDRCGPGANVHLPRFAVVQRMAELDRERETLKKRRLVQGLGSFLEEQAFMLLRQSRVPQQSTRSLWLELVYAQMCTSDPPRLGNCAARAA